MISLTIDGKKVEVEEGTSVLQAAEKVGVKIPTLCYHKALPAYGACRLCIVEVSQGEGARSSVQASCTYPAMEGLVVKTNTERIQRDRKIMAELILARCPDSEEIKKIAHEVGVETTRVERTPDDCILCGLCVRICKDRMGRGAIGFSGRGSLRKIEPAFDTQSDVCQTCGACYFICPTGKGIKLDKISGNKIIPIPSEFDRGLRERPSIYISFPQAVPNYATIDAKHCAHIQTGECQICKEFCEADAINFDQKEENKELGVGSLIISPGYSLFNPVVKTGLGYGKFPNVLTSAEFERILSPSGPYKGHILRPSDGKEPKRIAFIQCVGSRDDSPESRAPYCSGVCCMHSIKEAVIAKEHVKDIQSTIFYMDIRAYGKDFDKYYERSKNEYKVNYVKSKVDMIVEDSESHNLIVHYITESGKLETMEFDMVVLAVGFRPPENIEDLSDRLKLRLNKYNYVRTEEFNPIATTQPGIFACGAVSSPKDIPETVMQASGAVAGASELLASVRGTEIVEKELPPERDVRGETPRIGVFVCHCGINIGSVVDVPGVVEFAKTLPNVIHSEANLFTCSQDTQEKMKEVIKEYNLNRIIVASCTPRTHEPLFQETLKEAGLNPYLFEMANIRDQCSWVHMNIPEQATEKSKDLVRMAVAKSRLLEPLPKIKLDVIQTALIIGGGLAGMVSALSIANQGYEVVLIEKDKQLGGNLRNLYYTVQGNDVQELLVELVNEVKHNKNIKVYLESDIDTIDGYVGNFKTTFKHKNKTIVYEHGVVIVAIGGEQSRPKEYLYGQKENVITQLDLEKMLVDSEKILEQKGKKPPTPVQKLKNVVMIQCVGSRDDEHPYCSRVCCTDAIKNALKLRELNPKTNIYILYRDIRTYGFLEEYYELARDKGIMFIHYDVDRKPVVQEAEGSLVVKVNDPILGRQLNIDADLLVLAPAIIPRRDVLGVSQMLKVPLNEDNFFLEAHVKLRPVDFANEGVFLAGLAHSPKNISETISQAKAAASRAATIISKDKYEAEATISSVNEDVCVGCGVCVSVCPYDAPELIEKEGKVISHVREALCKGCGNCVCSCPSGAIQHLGYNDIQTLNMLNMALK
ncbi:FAD-dependent oxidoreductase [bacterium]|nr:FAD-dependent oxidoreductase [bacterium]